MTVARTRLHQSPLPEYLLLSIFCEVDWRTLIFIIRTVSIYVLLKHFSHIPQTCRSFHALTRTRILWVRLLRIHSQRHGIPHHFDAPLVSYSASDLERLFLVRVGADIQLSDSFEELTPGCHIHRQRHLRLRSNLRLLVSHLIEGGRWLIALTNEGTLLCWDLDSGDVGESCQLLGDAPVWDDPNPSWNRCDVGETTSCINIVEGAPTLTFRFAIFHVSFCTKAGHESDGMYPSFQFGIKLIKSEQEAAQGGDPLYAFGKFPSYQLLLNLNSRPLVCCAVIPRRSSPVNWVNSAGYVSGTIIWLFIRRWRPLSRKAKTEDMLIESIYMTGGSSRLETSG